MITASRRFSANVGVSAVRWVTEVAWTNDGANWTVAPLVSGSVTRSLSDQIHWQASLVLANVPTDLAGVQAYNTRLRIRHGIQFGENDVELIPFGHYLVTDVDSSDASPEVGVDAVSYERFLMDAEPARPVRFKPQSADSMLRGIVASVIGAEQVSWRSDVAHLSREPMPQMLVEGNRWDYLDGGGGEDSVSIADALGVRIHADASGGLIVVPVATMESDPVGDLSKQRLVVDPRVTLTRDGVANIVIATGATVDGDKVVGPVEVRDTDPESPTYFGRSVLRGGFGHVPYRLTNPLLRTRARCLYAARAKLAERIGLRLSVTFAGAHNPLTEPGDVWLFHGQRIVLDSVTYDLRGGAMQATTRTQATRLDGVEYEVVDTSGSEGL